MPVGGGNTCTERGENIRQAVNRWIRSSGTYDAVIDFDAVVRGGADPAALLVSKVSTIQERRGRFSRIVRVRSLSQPYARPSYAIASVRTVW